MKRKKIYICWYFFVELIYDVSREKFEELSWHKIWEWWVVKQKWKCPIIFIHNPEPHIVAHEAFHAVCQVAEVVWIKLSSDSEEWYAHSIDKIVKEILNILK